MGTQFSSRLSPSDCKRIRAGLKQARESVLGKAFKRRRAGKTVLDLPPSGKQQFGKEVMRQVLTVADERDFLRVFAESKQFGIVLDWLRRLYSDAAFDGFKGIIREYQLQKEINISARLREVLRKLTRVPEGKRQDPFHSAVVAAAIAVLAEVVIKRGPGGRDLSEAQKFGAKLKSMTIKDVVELYVRSFIHEFAVKIMSRADPHEEDTSVQEGRKTADKEARRVGRKVVKEILREGALNDTPRIHELVIEEFKQLKQAA
jgi:bifunctional DNA-binding transcriptional regulator/antitoxin component of YhaV-PrlF toxin-antitoxin module